MPGNRVGWFGSDQKDSGRLGKRVFIGHNGAQSYYVVRGFRGMLKV
jgi:hypothetical protein